MNTNEIIQDYGKTVSPEVYIRMLQEHPYIPQSNTAIMRIIEKELKEVAIFGPSIIDVGCGPGELTFEIAKLGPSTVVGVDISKSFIKYAEEKQEDLDSHNEPYLPFKFVHGDFAKDFDYTPDYANVILMQGVMHHIHGEDRATFFKKSFDLLKTDGILIIGDEFIRGYEDEDQRKIFATEFYCHIIDEARKGGFNELAEEEARNLIDDAFSNTKYAGFHNQKAFDHIYQYSKIINEMFYQYGILSSDAYNQIQNLFRRIRESTEDLVIDYEKSVNRGDYKTSISEFSEEVSLYGFSLEEKYEIGPVKQLGGMGVLVFKKQNIPML